jgi:hypothetical protein
MNTVNREIFAALKVALELKFSRVLSSLLTVHS